MRRIEPARRRYAWGSATAIPAILGVADDGDPWAEAWYGSHPGGPARIAEGRTLSDLIEAEPERLLGDDVIRRFGFQLPFLLKLIAPEQPLSLQVHPSQGQAAEGYALEDEAGVALDHPARNYKDTNHKPEMVLALTRFQAVAGFRAPRRAGQYPGPQDAPPSATQPDPVRHPSGLLRRRLGGHPPEPSRDR